MTRDVRPVAIAFIRGIARRQMKTIGNFWVDMVRACLWVLLPFSIIGALLLVSQGVVQNLKPYVGPAPLIYFCLMIIFTFATWILFYQN